MPMRMKNEQKDKALHVSCEGRIGAAFGAALFGDCLLYTSRTMLQYVYRVEGACSKWNGGTSPNAWHAKPTE